MSSDNKNYLQKAIIPTIPPETSQILYEDYNKDFQNISFESHQSFKKSPPSILKSQKKLNDSHFLQSQNQNIYAIPVQTVQVPIAQNLQRVQYMPMQIQSLPLSPIYYEKPITMIEKSFEVPTVNDNKFYIEENKNELELRLAMLFNENTNLKSLIEESHQTIQNQNQKIIELERQYLNGTQKIELEEKLSNLINENSKLKYYIDECQQTIKQLKDSETTYKEKAKKSHQIQNQKIVEVPVDRIIEKRIEVPVDRIIEKRIEVPIDRIIEKRIEVPTDRIIEKRVEVPVDRIVEKRIEVMVPIEHRVEVPVEIIKRVEVPVEVIKVVEIPKIIEKVIYKTIELPASTQKKEKSETVKKAGVPSPSKETIRILENRLSEVLNENEKIKNIREQKYPDMEAKLIFLSEENQRLKYELENRITTRQSQSVYRGNDFEHELSKYKFLVEEWRNKYSILEAESNRNSRKSEKIEVHKEKIIDRPFEVVKFIDRTENTYDKTRLEQLEKKLFSLQQEYDENLREINRWKSRCFELEHREPQIIEKIIEKPVEIFTEIHNDINNDRLFELNRELDSYKLKIYNLIKEIEKNKEELKIREIKIREYEVLIREYEQKNNLRESHVRYVDQGEKDRLLSEIRNKNEIIREFEINEIRFRNAIKELEENKLNMSYQINYNEQNNRDNKFLIENKTLLEKIKEYEEKLVMLSTENERLNFLINKGNHNSLKISSSEIDKYNIQISQVDDSPLKISSKENDRLNFQINKMNSPLKFSSREIKSEKDEDSSNYLNISEKLKQNYNYFDKNYKY